RTATGYGHAAGRIRNCRILNRNGGIRASTGMRNAVFRLQLLRFPPDGSSRVQDEAKITGPLHSSNGAESALWRRSKSARTPFREPGNLLGAYAGAQDDNPVHS